MKRNEFNSKFREYTKEELSPNKQDRDFVSTVYESFRKVLNNNCIQIGSFPRFTASRPIHDLDILYFAGQYDPRGVNPTKVLGDLQKIIQSNFVNPTRYSYSISLQTHSLTVSFTENDQEVFSVDIVPAYISDTKNEFGGNVYWVPEIMNIGHSKRKNYYEDHLQKHLTITWIKSDPRGYISVAQSINDKNEDFRKAVKFVKAWKFGCKQLYDDFKLKSFHIEQIITEYFKSNSNLDFFSAVFKFFSELHNTISNPKIRDRANGSKFIDDYLDELTQTQKQKILQSRDFFMNKLERLTEAAAIAWLLEGGFYNRKSDTEQFLFDLNIPTLTDSQFELQVDGRVDKKDGFRGGYLLSTNQDRVPVDRKITFHLTKNTTGAVLYKWKVKNDDQSEQPRGEITDHKTRNHPEKSSYRGTHYVECYAITDGVCIAKHKRNVKIY